MPFSASFESGTGTRRQGCHSAAESEYGSENTRLTCENSQARYR